MELPEGFFDTQWPFQDEVDMLQRMQAMRHAMDDKLHTMARDFRAHRFYPRRTETRNLELRVHHTFVPPVLGTEETPGIPGRWTLHLNVTDSATGSPVAVNLTTIFRKVSIELDPRLYSDSIVEWTCFQKGTQEVNALEVTRHGHTPHALRIKLLPRQPMERFSLSAPLTAAIGGFLGQTQSFDKSEIMLAIWQYVKHKNLIKEDDCRVIVCDATLHHLFQCDSLPFASLVVALRPHLTPATTLDVEYQLALDTSEEKPDQDMGGEQEKLEAPAADSPLHRRNERVFPVDVARVDDVEMARNQALRVYDELQQEQAKDLELLAQQEAHIVAQLAIHYRKYEWMQQLATDPAGFVAAVVRSQQADQQILTAEADMDEISLPHTQQFVQPWVREIVSELFIAPSTSG